MKDWFCSLAKTNNVWTNWYFTDIEDSSGNSALSIYVVLLSSLGRQVVANRTALKFLLKHLSSENVDSSGTWWHWN